MAEPIQAPNEQEEGDIVVPMIEIVNPTDVELKIHSVISDKVEKKITEMTEWINQHLPPEYKMSGTYHFLCMVYNEVTDKMMEPKLHVFVKDEGDKTIHTHINRIDAEGHTTHIVDLEHVNPPLPSLDSP